MMCEWGDVVVIVVDGKPVTIDRCLEPMIKALNDNGFKTVASCCGHGKRPGIISFADGREFSILPDREVWLRVEEFYTKELNCKPIN